MSPERQSRGPEPALTGLYLPRRSTWHLIGQANEPSQGGARTDWRLKLDPDNIGVHEGWPERGLPGETVAAEVPGVWNTSFPGYAGVAWYEAVCKPDHGLLFTGTITLVVGAANYLTDAWLNGVYLGRHEGGYDAFSFRCTDEIRRGENRLTLRIVDPPLVGEIDGLNLHTTPTAKESWYGGAGGPWGGVWFEETAGVMLAEPARVWLQEVRVHGDLASQRATFQITLASGLPGPTRAQISAHVGSPGASASVEVPPRGTTAVLTVSVPAPEPWSPESPTLYDWVVAVRLADEPWTDVAMDWLGFRTCELRDGMFYLNGEPRYLKGALLQPTYPRSLLAPTPPAQPGRPPSSDDGVRCEQRLQRPDEMPAELWRTDVQLAKEAGLNLLRCHLRPPVPGLLSACDRQGIMAYVEPPLAWIEPSGRLLEHGRRELTAMVRLCGNHPSVVMWGIFNENARATEAVGGDLMAKVVALDPTRPIVENSGGAAVGEDGMWAWGGQSRCWSPGWEAPRPLNDVHIYLANPLRDEARDLLATVGDGPTLDVTPGRPPAQRIESRLSADAVLVSEYGCGALPDFDAALAAFGDEQHLADAVLLRDLRDDLARGLSERGLDREIGDVTSLVAQTQALQAEGILAQTAALRRNPNVSGIVLTQLADAGWEQMAGLVGLWRHPRPALDALRRALQPRLLHVEPADPCSDGAVRVRAWLIEEPGLPPLHEAAVLTVTLESVEPPHQPLSAPASIPVLLPDSPLRQRGPKGPGVPFPEVSLPVPTAPGRYQVRARLTAGTWTGDAICKVRRLPDVPQNVGAGLVVLGRGLRAALPEALTTLPPDWSGPILAHLPSRPALATLAKAGEWARAGAHLCLIGLEPRTAEQLTPLLGLPLAVHGARGNFMGMHHYLRDHQLFAGLGAVGLVDAAFAEVLPAWALDELPGATVLAGCFTVPDGGRSFLWRASVQTLPLERGRLTLCQLNVGAHAGGVLGHYLLDALTAWLLTENTGSNL